MDAEVLRIGAARSIQYVLRDTLRGLPDIAVFRVDGQGRLDELGTLIAVRPEGFVMQRVDGQLLHSDGPPWWLFDMLPAGYLGRAYAARHGAALGLPARLADWTDTHALRALLANGHDLPGNLLLGERAREHFLAVPLPEAIGEADKADAYPRLAREAAQGEQAGSSAGGEQPKFTSYVVTPDGPRHVIVKFSEPEDTPISQRWRDLLLAEHLALETLAAGGVPAARSRVLDLAGQRFLEVERFDRTGALGRQALLSLRALDAEFVGASDGSWPALASRLCAGRHIRPEAVEGAALLWAFGKLIGNTDMHPGNLSFTTSEGRPYSLAPAYDMNPMGFCPEASGRLKDELGNPADIRADVSPDSWRQAAALAEDFLRRVKAAPGFSARFLPCIAALEAHQAEARRRIARLA